MDPPSIVNIPAAVRVLVRVRATYTSPFTIR